MQANEYAQATPLSDEICEAAVLGSLLCQPTSLDAARGKLTERCFTLPKHIVIFQAIMAIDKRGESINIVSVWEELQRHPPSFAVQSVDVAMLLDSRTLSVDIKRHVTRLIELARRRDFQLIIEKFRAAALDETVSVSDMLMSARSDIDNLLTRDTEQVLTMKDSLKSVTHIIQDNQIGTKSIGTATGFKLLDKYGGFHGSDLIIMAGDTSSGKSSLALSIARNMINANIPIAYYSMEMQHYQLTARIMAMQSGVTSSSILYRKLSDYDMNKIDQATAQLIDKCLYYDDKSVLSLSAILASIRSMHIKYGIKGAFVDYLQIINLGESRGMSREQATANAARDLKNLAKSLNIWIVALSQLSRRKTTLDGNKNYVPTMDRLRDSGQIAEAADSVILIYRPEYYGIDVKFPAPYKERDTHNKAMIIIPKGRNIGVGEFICNFIPELTLFTEDDVSYYDNAFNKTNNTLVQVSPQQRYEQNDYGDALPF